MRRVFLAVLLLLAGRAGAGPGRPFPFDSLRATVRRPMPDSERVYKALEAYQALIYARPDSAQVYARAAMTLARRIRYAKGEANAYGALAGYEFQLKRYAPAQRYYQLMLAAARRAHHANLEGTAYSAMASMALNTGNTETGLRYYRQALAVFARARPRSYDNEVLTLVNLSNYYLEHGLLPRAVPLVRQAAALLPRTTWPELPVAVGLNLGQVQARQHQPDSAAAAWRRTVQLATAAHLDELAAQGHAHLAELLLTRAQPGPALAEAHAASVLAHRSQAAAVRADALAVLAQAMQTLGRPAAFDTLRQAQVLRDSVHARENAAALSLTQARFHDAEQQGRIRALEQQRQLSQQTQELTRLRTQRTLLLLGGLAALLLAGAGAALWQVRRRQQQREAALRQRLAADLHDDVGNLLTQISLQADLLRETPAAGPGQLLARLQRLSDTSRLATRQMADVVRGLHASTLALPELLLHLREHAYEVLGPAGLAVDFQVAPEVSGLHPVPATCQHLYLIYKEALHNAVKHAHAATLVTVRLERDGPCLCLRVHDDGRVPAPAPPPARPSGHGLRNMRQRAEEAGGTLRLEATATGFGVVACLPA